VDVPATIGRTEFEIAGDFGVIERTQSRDFLVLAEDLVLAGSSTLPARGDRIREIQGGTTYVCLVWMRSVLRYGSLYRQCGSLPGAMTSDVWLVDHTTLLTKTLSVVWRDQLLTLRGRTPAPTGQKL
jgi:hypothetical protein